VASGEIMRKFNYDTADTLRAFWNNETPKIIEAKNFILNVIFPYLEKNKELDTKFFVAKITKIGENKALILDSGDYKRVYFFLKSDEDYLFSSKLDDYKGKYLMAMFFISDDNYYENTEVIENYMTKVFEYLGKTRLHEMVWNNASFERPDNVKINVHYNEIKDQKPLSMDYVDAMFNISVVSSNLLV
jgi:hypothetical protein